MNIELLEKVAARIEQEPRTTFEDQSGFNMNYYFHSCGTPSCVAGWIIHESGGELSHPYLRPMGYAAMIAQLPLDDARQLFMPGQEPPEHTDRQSYWLVKAPEAARVIRHLIATGEVDWSILDAEAS